VITIAKADCRHAQRFFTGASPSFDGLHTYARAEPGPLVDTLRAEVIASFITTATTPSITWCRRRTNPPEFTLFQVGANERARIGFSRRPTWGRNAYIARTTTYSGRPSGSSRLRLQETGAGR